MRLLSTSWIALILFAGGAAAQEPAPMPREEPLKYPTGLKVPADIDEQIKLSWLRHKGKMQALPKVTASEFDWRTLGLDIPVENQGNCGSCWDFSGTDGAGYALVKAGKLDKSELLSKQQVLDCERTNGGCNGDWPSTPLKYAKEHGIAKHADYGPYLARRGSCKQLDDSKYLKIKDWGYVGSEQGVPPTQAIKDAMAKYGPIPCAVAADSSFNNPGDRVIRGSNRGINHAVIIVGWKDDPSLPEGGYWIMRNSWDKSWGMGGYCKIAYGAKSIGYGAIWVDAGQSPTPPDPVPPNPDPPGPTPKGFTGTVTTVYANGVIVSIKTGGAPAEGLDAELKAAGLDPRIILHVIKLIKDLKAKDWDAVLDDIAKILESVLSEKNNKPKDREKMPDGPPCCGKE